MGAMLRRLLYFVSVALQGMARARSLTATCTVTLAAALLVMGAFGMVLGNARDLVHVWGQGGQVSCGLQLGSTPDVWEHARAAAQKIAGVRTARIETPEAGLAHFRQRSIEAAQLTEGVTAEMVPASLLVEPNQSLVADVQLKQLAESLRNIPGVVEVVYGEAQLARLRQVVRIAAWVGFGIGALMAVAMLFMVANTVRLMIYARRDEVRILKLVGATAWFVRTPFLIEGLIWGLLAGALGACGLFGLDRLLAEPLGYVRATLGHAIALKAYSSPLALAQIALGGVLGLVGSAVALFLTPEEDMG